MKARLIPIATLLLAACGGGQSDTPTVVSGSGTTSAPVAVVSTPISGTPTATPPAPTPAASAPSTSLPSPGAPPASALPAASPPAVTPPPPVSTPAVSPTVPVSGALPGSAPDTGLTCARGTPMYWARPTVVGYNGGVLRFVPKGGVEIPVILEVSNMTVQQHSGATTYSAPTSDGRQGWFTIDKAGTLIGGGYHGTDPGSYLRCGDAMAGVEAIKPVVYRMACTSGMINLATGEKTFDPPSEESIGLDASTYPWASLLGAGRLVPDPTGSLAAGGGNTLIRDDSVTGDVNVYIGGAKSSDGSFYTLSEGRLISAERPGSHAAIQSYACTTTP